MTSAALPEDMSPIDRFVVELDDLIERFANKPLDDSLTMPEMLGAMFDAALRCRLGRSYPSIMVSDCPLAEFAWAIDAMVDRSPLTGMLIAGVLEDARLRMWSANMLKPECRRGT